MIQSLDLENLHALLHRLHGIQEEVEANKLALQLVSIQIRLISTLVRFVGFS